MSIPIKIELGGGKNPRGAPFLNIDRIPIANIVLDIEKAELPFSDDSVDEVYSAHCLEHISNLVGILKEILRVCHEHAIVELHFPHWLQSMAMCYDHKHVIGEQQVRIWCEHPGWDFPGSEKYFVLSQVHYVKESVAFNELRPLFPQMSDIQVCKYIPGCCHEVRFTLRVAKR